MVGSLGALALRDQEWWRGLGGREPQSALPHGLVVGLPRVIIVVEVGGIETLLTSELLAMSTAGLALSDLR